ncbi:Brachyurin [Amphibalanus amphitrite]|uniref:Brachyurin n=1 Tax=Amphibalanus amphitrite TaxID=1232801 RepID=A0A6A4WXY5_AMPAM|nr:Brachyurin [Amphibalanus amphitrite]
MPGVPLTLTSTNYPGPYPPNECRKLVLTPTDAYTSVVMVCTDVDTFRERACSDSGGFTPPEKVEYIFTPIRFSAPFDPEQGPPAFFRRERVTSNTTESPLKVVPYVVTPHPVVLHATADEGCGLAGPGVQARVFGGEDALPGSYPWVVYLVSDSPKSTTKTTYCTGSLISRRWVLTAAHCVDYAVTTTISMGYLDVSKETNLTLKMESNDYRVHPYWTRLAKEHDVALVRLPRDVTWTEHVRPICLPRRSEVGNTFVEARAEICGWGKTYNDQKGGSFVLQRAEVPIRSNCDCMASFPINMTPLKICCHGRFHSPCQGDSGGVCPVSFADPLSALRATRAGDSGGPLQLRRHGRYTLLGVSSFTSAQGCDVGMPAIYTRVTAYLDWIEDNSGLVVPL